MPDTPQKIFAYLRAHPASSAEEISQALLLTAPNTRHHLRELMKDGAVILCGKDEPSGRGRPTLRFSLSGQHRENNLAVLAHTLLVMLAALQSPVDIDMAMRRIADYIVPSTPDSPPASIKRLNQSVTALNQMHYQAHWEARSTGPWMFLGPCPYAALLPEHPQLCLMDRSLLERLCGAPVNQLQRQRGSSPCIFSISTSSSRTM